MFQHRFVYLLVSSLLLSFAAAQAGVLTVETGQAVYATGDPIQITITNPTTEPVELSSDPCYSIVHDATQTCVVGCLGLPVITTILPGESLVYEHGSYLLPDPVGFYTVTVHELDGGAPADPLPTTQYFLEDVIESESTTWGAVKALY